ncbi:FUN14 family-domain-containing protein [Endogone sp. FLAS-F59071]|nr:FUN14 family-domain-containing protein [Endogone sp. FLAS-F59071]|eukprot:RUS19163.1 FUN14 family-domain-containing protein [Endogone sp. FLAS-F59071]
MFRLLRPIATARPMSHPASFSTLRGASVRPAKVQFGAAGIGWMVAGAEAKALPTLVSPAILIPTLHATTPALVFGATAALYTSARTTYPVACEVALDPNIITPPRTNRSIVRPSELAFGTSLGFCTGYLIKKVGRVFALMVGVTFVLLQYLSFKGLVTVHWDRMAWHYTNQLDKDKDGKVTASDLRTIMAALLDFLTANFQFKSTFVGGFYAGLRYG